MGDGASREIKRGENRMQANERTDTPTSFPGKVHIIGTTWGSKYYEHALLSGNGGGGGGGPRFHASPSITINQQRTQSSHGEFMLRGLMTLLPPCLLHCVCRGAVVGGID